MKDWLASALLESADSIPEDAEGHVLGRGLPYALVSEMRVGVWKCPQDPCPDASFTKRYGEFGQRVEGWLSFPLWSPRGHIIGVEFRSWEYGDSHEPQKFYLPDSGWLPVFVGMVPSAFHRIWDGGDVWLVEGWSDLAVAHVIPEEATGLANGGAKITSQQVAFLSRFLSPRARVHVCFDMDETGQKMARGYTHPETGKRVWGVVERLERAGVKARVVVYRGGKDPGEIWEKSGTPALRNALAL
jgi:DNA primase